MGIFSQLKMTLSYNARKVASKMEKPEVMVDHAIQEMKKQYETMRKAVAAALADTKQMEIRLNSTKEKVKTWEERAKLALEKNNEDLARQALEQKLDLEKTIGKRTEEYNDQKSKTDKLKSTLDEMKENLDRMTRERNVLEARLKTAQAQKKISESMVAADGGTTSEEFAQLMDTVERLEAEAATIVEMNDDGKATLDLEAEFAKLESDGDVDVELEKLKSSIASD